MAISQEDIQQVLNAIKAESQGVQELEEVTSLNGVNSLPAVKGNELVSVPVSLLQKPATDAAAKAEDAAQKATQAAQTAEDAKDAANSAATTANESADKANAAAAAAQEAAASYEGTAKTALEGATARFSGFIESGEIQLASSASAGGVVVYIKSKKLFAYQLSGKYYNNWNVEGVPSPDLFLAWSRNEVLKDKTYICGDTLYVWSEEDGDLVKASGGGSGSGFYNVTQLHPLPSGYYTKDTAVAALADADIDDDSKPGMVITFEVSAGKWLDYRLKERTFRLS